MNTALLTKAKKIRLLALDVDGILTNAVLYYGNDGVEVKGFHTHDGLGIKLLQKAGIAIAVISARHSTAVENRLKELNIEHVYLGHTNKLSAYNDLKQKVNLNDDEIAYMGDDLPDLPVLRRVGLAITVPEAANEVIQAIDFITTNKGGCGAVREVSHLLLNAQEKYHFVLESYDL